jgi:Ca-activated chloride channel family protein
MNALALAALAHGAPDEHARFRTADGGGLVLTHTSVDAVVELGLATVTVEQTFHNPYEEPVDATYLFPLPADAAVQDLTLTCGSRRIEGELLTRSEAREQYEAAAAEGRKAALLEQERTTLFRQSVAGLCPGELVTVSLTYLDPLAREDGRTELVFPTTVGPLYRPDGTPEPPFTTVPSRDLDVHVRIAEVFPTETFSDSHALEVEEDGSGVDVWNASGDDLPNKDFHLAWTSAGPQTELSVLALPPTGDEDGYVALTLEPQVLEDLTDPRPRELVFVIDESCSMQGAPFEAARDTVRLALDQMRPGDRFDLVSFSSDATALFAAPQPATPANVAAAQDWLSRFDGGGTDMTRGVVKALTLPHDPERMRLVLMVTDGFIGNDPEVLRTVRQHLGDARLFSLGVGSSVNRRLLDGLADVGRGDVTVQLPGTPPGEVVDTFYERIAHPALSDVTVDWGGLDVVETYPAVLPDLFAGQPVRVVARVRGELADAVVTVRGDAGREELVLRRPLVVSEAQEHPGLPALWARRKIADLTRRAYFEGGDAEAEVTAVALAHHLVSEYTSLVAAERSPSGCGPARSAVEVPSLVPSGVVAENVGGLGFGGGGFGGGGLGSLGTRGLGSGSSGYGTGGGTFGAKGEGGLGAVGGDPIILGSLDRSVIDQVVKRNLNALRYCYQRELTKDPTLGGAVVVKFTIAADGTVSQAAIKSSTLGSPAVESCLVGRFLRAQFPAPAGGGTVVVSYPLVFSPQ